MEILIISGSFLAGISAGYRIWKIFNKNSKYEFVGFVNT